VSAREYLEKANRYQVKPEELFQYFAQNVLQLTVLYQKSPMGKKPLLARSNRPGAKYVIAFTDQEAAKIVRVRQPEHLEMTEEPALPFLLKAYRSNAEGLMFNPGMDSKFFVVQHQLLEWIRFYCIHMFSKQSTAWVIRSGSSVLKGAYQPGFSTIAIYTGEEDAGKSAEKSGGVATPVSWEKIFQYLEQLGSKTLYVNFGLPEAFLLNPDQVEKIKNSSQTGFVEQTTNSYSFIPDVPDIPIPSEEGSQLPKLEESQVVEKEETSDESSAFEEDWESAFAEEEPLTFGSDRQLTDTYKSIVNQTEKQETEQEKADKIAEEKSKETNTPAINQAKVTESEKIPESEPIIEQTPAITFEPVTEKKPEIKPEPVIEQKPEVKPEPVIEQKPEVKPEPAIEQKPVVEQKPVIEQKPMKKVEAVKEKEEVKSEQNQGSSSGSPHTLSAFDNPWDEDDDGFSDQIPQASLFFQSDNQVNNKQEQKKEEIVEKTPEKIVTNHSQQPVIEEKQPVQETSKPEKTEPVQQRSSSIPEDVAYGLRVLEAATNEGQGMANGWEVCRALADLRRIWVIVDMEGKMVILASQDENQIADFFTSEEYAQTLIDEAHRRNQSLPRMVPRLISTKKVFKALAPTQCIIWINRGSANAWTSIMGDTLPYVLQLMAQK
jgi:hypothetical protein